MDARTWSYGGRDWPYDGETSAEIDARVEAAKYADGGSPSDLERYENEVFAPTLISTQAGTYKDCIEILDPSAPEA